MQTEISDLKIKLQSMENLNRQLQQKLFQVDAKSACDSHHCDELVHQRQPLKME